MGVVPAVFALADELGDGLEGELTDELKDEPEYELGDELGDELGETPAGELEVLMALVPAELDSGVSVRFAEGDVSAASLRFSDSCSPQLTKPVSSKAGTNHFRERDVFRKFGIEFEVRIRISS